MVGEEQRDAALVLAREHQQRPVVGAGHHRRAGAHLRADEAQPLAPGRRRLLRARQVAGDRMALAAGGDRLVGLLDDARRPGVPAMIGAERRARRGSPAPANSGPGRDQHARRPRARSARCCRNRSSGRIALVGVAVEDDEVELLDLLLEQLARREGDQRQLVDRRAVLLLGRAQDGEVDEVDVGVGLQEVAPGALARHAARRRRAARAASRGCPRW